MVGPVGGRSYKGVEVIHGNARITSPWTVEVNGQIVRTRAIVIATGARPTIPSIPGLEQVRYYTSETIWSCWVANQLVASWHRRLHALTAKSRKWREPV